MALKQIELSQRFYKKQKLQKLADKLLSEWERNPNKHHSMQDIRMRINRICDLPRGWSDNDYENALKQIDSLEQELQSAPSIVSTIPKLTDLIISALNIVNAGPQDKASALIDAFYRTQGFSAIEDMYNSLGKVIKEEKDRQTVAAHMQGFYDPSNLPKTDDTQLPKNNVKFKL